MTSPNIAGIDAGHVVTKAVVLREGRVVGYGSAPTRLDPAAAARLALDAALAGAGLSQGELAGVASTGIYRDAIQLSTIASVPEHMAAAWGALLSDGQARTLIDIGGNIHKIIRFDPTGNLLDAAQNDKCADGLGVFFSAAARSLGLTEAELSELAGRATGDHALAIQCAISAQSDATDLVCRGVPAVGVARAMVGYVAERVASLCRAMPLTDRVVVAGGLARSAVLIVQLETRLGHDLIVPERPEFLGAIGAAMRGRP